MPVSDISGTLLNDEQTISLFAGGGPDAIQNHISQITKSAFEKSPLYWTYQAKHKPSVSRVCLNKSSTPKKSMNGNVRFTNLILNKENIMLGESVSPITTHGYDFGSLGEYTSHCFCGWDLQLGLCKVPNPACIQLKLDSVNCNYALASQDFDNLMQNYDPSWPCPFLDFSEHFGILDRDAHEQWLLGRKDITTSLDTLLRYGPGGIRAGSLRMANTNTIPSILNRTYFAGTSTVFKVVLLFSAKLLIYSLCKIQV
jgi:hypothetical protein